ncbi:unnamed protein product [Penicillium nalgiovense]|uniref:Aminoglycoside phosphotransferase domain-containing protein n=1 Tax=Penicillium nalgiovense TaxID=60175 RepID=A0A9W4H9I2_PENNA|nr:unnamed protein product [Penicillium nalgiovense]CAG7939735.1 unnamed protein product [Penicillium nalgiovense]CAG7941437.1 unnamed protein product [Penicillium nalgiovense]CAG7942981.1 unnamed protein product [Penicillium nalgiovense]CAG7957548.1 unnamed protein product [Penicillium nalgiovense]
MGNGRPDDFRIDVQHVNSQSSDSLEYWASVVDLCNEAATIYPAGEGDRDVFSLGSIIIKSSHLHTRESEIHYLYADANEVEAIAIAKNVLKDVKVPDIYFNGKILINGRQVLVQEMLPGVALAVAWPYLSQTQKESFKQQARAILRQLHSIKPTDRGQIRCHVVPDPGTLTRIHPLEGDILFSDSNTDPDMSFMHNDFNIFNIIVDMTKSWDSSIGKWLASLVGTQLGKFIVGLDSMTLHFGKISMSTMSVILEG